MLKRLLPSIPDQKEEKKAIETIGNFFPDGVPQIIQGYLSDEKPRLNADERSIVLI